MGLDGFQQFSVCGGNNATVNGFGNCFYRAVGGYNDERQDDDVKKAGAPNEI